MGFERSGRTGRTPRSGIPYGARPRSRTALDAGLRLDVDLVHDRAGDTDTVLREQRRVEHDLVDRAPDAALADDDRRGAERGSDGRVRQSDDRPDAGMSGALDEEHVAPRANWAWAAAIFAPRSSTTSPAMYALVNPRGMCTGLSTVYGSGSPNVARMSTASSSAGSPSSMTVRCPTGFMKPAFSPRRRNPSRRPRGCRRRPLPPSTTGASPNSCEIRHQLSEDRGDAPASHRSEDCTAGRPPRAACLRASYECEVVLRSISATPSRSRPTVSASTASVSRYGPSRSITSATRPRNTAASATKN